MSYYEDEILHELSIGKTYTEKQLRIFIIENTNVAVISKSYRCLMDSTQNTHIVIDIIDGYEHKGDKRTYYIPSTKTKKNIID